MSKHEPSLPEPWIERIWSTMRACYGAAFDRMWACPAGADPKEHVAQLKAVWGRELRHLQQNPMALRYALDHLPERVPNVIEFRNICHAAPRPQAAPLSEPPASLERVKAELAKLGHIPASQRSSARIDHKAWARRLIARHEAGEKVRPIALRFAREALGLRVA